MISYHQTKNGFFYSIKRFVCATAIHKCCRNYWMSNNLELCQLRQGRTNYYVLLWNFEIIHILFTWFDDRLDVEEERRTSRRSPVPARTAAKFPAANAIKLKAKKSVRKRFPIRL